MKRNVIFIYDKETAKLIQVADIRVLENQQFEYFEEEANKNLKSILEEEKNEKEKYKRKVESTFNCVYERISDLCKLVAHILGYEELTENQIKEILNIHDGGNPNEQN